MTVREPGWDQPEHITRRVRQAVSDCADLWLAIVVKDGRINIFGNHPGNTPEALKVRCVEAGLDRLLHGPADRYAFASDMEEAPYLAERLRAAAEQTSPDACAGVASRVLGVSGRDVFEADMPWFWGDVAEMARAVKGLRGHLETVEPDSIHLGWLDGKL